MFYFTVNAARALLDRIEREREDELLGDWNFWVHHHHCECGDFHLKKK